MKTLLTILIFTLTLTKVYGQITTMIDKLNEMELEVLRDVKKYHKDLQFTQEVTRHYILKNGELELYNTTFNFTKDIDGFYFESYIYYSVELSPDLNTITYSFSAGQAYSTEGKVFIIGSVIRNDFSFGTTAGTITIWVNEKKVFEEFKEF